MNSINSPQNSVPERSLSHPRASVVNKLKAVVQACAALIISACDSAPLVELQTPSKPKPTTTDNVGNTDPCPVVTRGEVVVFSYDALGLSACDLNPDFAGSSCSDVPDDTVEDCKWGVLEGRGLVYPAAGKGDPTPSCRPDDGLTRAELAVLVARSGIVPDARREKGEPVPPACYEDETTWYDDAFCTLAQSGCIENDWPQSKGDPVPDLRPHDLATKCELEGFTTCD